MPVSHSPRHAAARPSRARAFLLPTVILGTGCAAFAGLAALPAGSSSVAVTAAAATSPLAASLAPLPVLVGHRNPDEQVPAASPDATPTRTPEHASRSRPLPPPPAPTFVRPGVGVLTSGFSWRWGQLHTGIDLAGPYWSPVVAVGDGQVIEAGWESGYGNIIKVQLDDGTVTYYAHLAQIVVPSGRVQAGQLIGHEGSTGFSTGPHLHFEVRVNGQPINPIPWLAARGIVI